MLPPFGSTEDHGEAERRAAEEKREDERKRAEQERQEAARKAEEERRLSDIAARQRAADQQKSAEQDLTHQLKGGLKQKLKEADFKTLESTRKDALKTELQKKIEEANRTDYALPPGVTGFTQKLGPSPELDKKAADKKKAEADRRAADEAYEARQAELRAEEKRRAGEPRSAPMVQAIPSNRFLDYCNLLDGQGSCACSIGAGAPGRLQRWCTDNWGLRNQCGEWFCGSQ